MDFFSGPSFTIAALTSLDFDPSMIEMRHDSSTLKHLQKLKEAGLLPDRRQLEKVYPGKVPDELLSHLPESNDSSAGILDSRDAIVQTRSAAESTKE